MDQELQGVPKKTPAMQPLEIHPRTTDCTVRLSRSYSGPLLISKGTQPNPRLRKQCVTWALPA
eukprot:14354735-Heterocapsa_arctica.AAC.1